MKKFEKLLLRYFKIIVSRKNFRNEWKGKIVEAAEQLAVKIPNR